MQTASVFFHRLNTSLVASGPLVGSCRSTSSRQKFWDSCHCCHQRRAPEIEMKMRIKSISALVLATITMAPAAVIPAASYNDTVKTNFSHPISNVPGTSLVAMEVSYAPGGASAPHRHSNSAFIYAPTAGKETPCHRSQSSLSSALGAALEKAKAAPQDSQNGFTGSSPDPLGLGIV